MDKLKVILITLRIFKVLVLAGALFAIIFFFWFYPLAR